MNKKIAIMQPYFFPYIGYFQLIKQTDKFILLDNVQFIHRGWVERNRVLKQNESWQYVAVPLVKAKLETLIKDRIIRNNENWQDKLLSQLVHYKKKSPFYNQTIEVVKESLNIKTDSIVELNYHVLKTVCAYLEINFNCDIFSKMNLTIETVNASDEWCLNITKAMDYHTYINPIGGIDIYDKTKYSKANIDIKFLKPILEPYKQFNPIENFEAGLSIIDVMMFNDIKTIKDMLDKYEFV